MKKLKDIAIQQEEFVKILVVEDLEKVHHHI